MKRVDPAVWVLLAAVAIFAFQALLGPHALQEGGDAPPVAVPMLGGGEATLGSPDEVQLVDFWATWCAPCVRSMPIVARVARELEPRGLKLYAVNGDEGADREARVQAFLKQLDLQVPVALDPGAAQAAYEVDTIPTLFLLKRGKVHAVHVGTAGEAELRALAEAALQ